MGSEKPKRDKKKLLGKREPIVPQEPQPINQDQPVEKASEINPETLVQDQEPKKRMNKIKQKGQLSIV